MNLSVKECIGLLDLTRLEAVMGDEAAIESLCVKALSPQGDVAAVCVHPGYVARAVGLLKESPVFVATVANFPSGDQSLKRIQSDVEMSLAAGVDEIDVVLPYKAWLGGDSRAVFTLLEAMRHWLEGRARVKAILETGAMPLPEQRLGLARAAAEFGVDFLKTSTGKVAIGATPEAVAELAMVANEYRKSVPPPGIKVAGGVRTIAQLYDYINQVENVMGSTFLVPERLRFGASRLLDDLLCADAST